MDRVTLAEVVVALAALAERLSEIRERWKRADVCTTDGVCLYLEGRPTPDPHHVDCDVKGWTLPHTPEAWAAGKTDVAALLTYIERLEWFILDPTTPLRLLEEAEDGLV